MGGLTIGNPVEFQAALISGNIVPGDVLKLKDGTYTGDYTASISGSVAKPVLIKPINQGMVTIDGSLTFNGTYVEFYDVDVVDTRADRTATQEGIYVHTVGIGIYGCVLRDLLNVAIRHFGSGGGSVCENVVYNNKHYFIYSHNEPGGLITIDRNVAAHNLGGYTLHVYSDGDNNLADYHIGDNILLNGNQAMHGGDGLSDFVFDSNIQYAGFTRIGKTADNIDGTITDNVFINLVEYLVQPGNWPEGQPVESGNLAYNDNDYVWPYSTGYTQACLPATYTRVIPFSKSARWVASVAILNSLSAETVAVDFSGIANGNYKLRNGQNMAENWAFTNIGGSINVPMTTWSAAAPIGGVAPATSTPIFGAFVVEKA